MALAELEQDDVDFEQDVKPALGPELDIVVLDLGQGADAPDPEVVALLQPGDPAKLDALLEKDTGGTPYRQGGGRRLDRPRGQSSVNRPLQGDALVGRYAQRQRRVRRRDGRPA